MESTAKIFKNGRSQAVRLPKEFRLKGAEVKIRKEGERVILEPIEKVNCLMDFGTFLKRIRNLKSRSQCHPKNSIWISRRPNVSA